MTESLKIFDVPLGPGGKPGHLYNQQELKKNLWNLFQGDKSLNIAQAKNSINLFQKDGVTPLPELGKRTNQGELLKQEAIRQGKQHLIYGFKDTKEDINTFKGLLKSNPEYFQ